MHRIRLAMQTGTFEKLSGEVEVDEMFIGGLAPNMHKGKRKVRGTGMIGSRTYFRELQEDGLQYRMLIGKAEGAT